MWNKNSTPCTGSAFHSSICPHSSAHKVFCIKCFVISLSSWSLGEFRQPQLFTVKTGMLVICKQNPYLIAAKPCLQIKVTGMWFYPQNKAIPTRRKVHLEGTCFHIPSSKKCLQYQGILQLYPKEATLSSGFLF